VGREHKSNGVFFVADLRRGLLAQRCFDPVCRAANYCSEPVLLSPFALERDGGVLDRQLLALDDADVAAARDALLLDSAPLTAAVAAAPPD
jgi:hypothetical protein